LEAFGSGGNEMDYRLGKLLAYVGIDLGHEMDSRLGKLLVHVRIDLGHNQDLAHKIGPPKLMSRLVAVVRSNPKYIWSENAQQSIY
jgi:hypothetical protein